MYSEMHLSSSFILLVTPVAQQIQKTTINYVLYILRSKFVYVCAIHLLFCYANSSFSSFFRMNSSYNVKWVWQNLCGAVVAVFVP